MQGRQLNNKPMESLYQALWRPRPPSLLNKEQKDEKYLRAKYWEVFSKKDEKLRATQVSGVQEERRKLKETWKALRQAHLRDYNEEAPMRAELRGGLLSDEEEDFETIETYVEEEVSRVEEVVSQKEYIAGQKAAKAERAAGAPASASAAAPSKEEEDD